MDRGMDIEKIEISRFPLKHEVFTRKKEIGDRLAAMRDSRRRFEADALRRRHRRNFVWVSAVVAAVVAVALFMLKVVTVTGSAGNGTVMSLPCGSTVCIAAGGEISYRPHLWNMALRRVELDGAARFSVEKGKGTFVVITDYGQVTVHGTEFEVSEQTDKMIVKCFKGCVEVTADSPDAPSVMLQAGEEVEVGKTGVSEPAVMLCEDDDNEDGDDIPELLNYNREELANVVAEIEHYFGVTVGNKWLCDGVTYTGVFYPKDMDLTLEVVFRSCGFDYTLKDGKVVLHRIE